MGGRIRPGYEATVTLSPKKVQEVVSRRLKSQDCPVSGLVAPGRLELHVHGAAQHLWSPQLIVDIRSEEEVDALGGGKRSREGRSRLRGRFGPHPSVWTMYVAGYAACTFIAFVGCSFGFAQWVMGEPAWALLTLPASALFAFGLYLLALLGQGLGEEQMSELRRFLDETTSAAIQTEAEVPSGVRSSEPEVPASVAVHSLLG